MHFWFGIWTRACQLVFIRNVDTRADNIACAAGIKVDMSDGASSSIYNIASIY